MGATHLHFEVRYSSSLGWLKIQASTFSKGQEAGDEAVNTNSPYILILSQV